MSRSSNRTKLICSALGTALLVPLLVIPASAAMDGGHFFVKAANTDSPEFHATAGMKGTTDGDSGSGGTGGGSDGGTGGGSDTGDNSAVLSTFSKGPLSLTVTQAMIDLSDANRKAAAEGGTVKTSPDGWQSIWFYDPATDSMTPTPTTSDPDQAMVFLSKTTDQPSVNDDLRSADPSPNGVFGYTKNGDSSSQVFDTRGTPKANATYFYQATSSGYAGNIFQEGRYISQDGKLVATKVDYHRAAEYNVSRGASPTDRTAPASDTEPYSLGISEQSNMLDIHLKTTVDGYNHIDLSENANGARYIRYGVYKGVDGNGNPVIDDAVRKDGPMMLDMNADGEINSFLYYDANGDRQYRGADDEGGAVVYTVADYNSITGQNWDGKFAKISDFDTALPFKPTGSEASDPQ